MKKTEIVIGRTYHHKRKKTAPGMTVLAGDLSTGKVLCRSDGVSVVTTRKGIGISLRFIEPREIEFDIDWFCKRYA
jgi:hypothetical protein